MSVWKTFVMTDVPRKKTRSLWFTLLLVAMCSHALVKQHSAIGTTDVILSDITTPTHNKHTVDASTQHAAVSTSAQHVAVDTPIPKEVTLESNKAALERNEVAIATTLPPRSDPFPPTQRQRVCVKWSVNSDDWWTHNPDWFVALENDTHYCFEPMPQDSPKAKLMLQMYHNQFQNNCSTVKTLSMWSSGWGADFSHIVNEMDNALKEQRPLQTLNRSPMGWSYATLPGGPKPVCPLRSEYCYLLNISNCPPVREDLYDGIPYHNIRYTPYTWYYEFVTRQQTWLRKEVYDYYKAHFQLTLPCSAIHVRRSDVALEGKHSRRYFPIEAYMNASYELDSNVLLLTDDQNAIPEAKAKFPGTNWMYEERQRHKGAEGGWQNPFPSGDAKYEVIVLLSSFKAVQHCRKLVRSSSNFGWLLEGLMRMTHDDNFTYYEVDAGQKRSDIAYANTTVLSRSNWTAEELAAFAKEKRMRRRRR
jgi:hypothetical protein